jgi:hypothetical protein
MLAIQHPIRLFSAATLLILLASFSAPADTLEATSDVWLRESSPDQTFETDLMSVWNSFGGDAGTRRYGVVEFDLSSLDGVTIDFASLQLWGGDTGFSDATKAIKQSALQIDTTGGTQTAALTWNIFQSEYSADAVALEGLGSLDLPAPVAVEQFHGGAASAADRSLIATVANAATGGNQLLTLVMVADELDGVEYAHSWGDGPDGYGGMNAQLVINEIPIENPDLRLRVDQFSGAMALVSYNTYLDVEIDGYTIESATGSLSVGGWNSLTSQAESGWQEVAPTANALSELNLTSSSTVVAGTQFDLGRAFVAGGTNDLLFEYSLAGEGIVVAPVEYTGTLSADFDDNGVVNNIDRILWQSGFGTAGNATKLQGDADEDKDSDGLDFLVWQREFGFSTNMTAVSGVPEPSAVLLLALALPVYLRLGRRGPGQPG